MSKAARQKRRAKARAELAGVPKLAPVPPREKNGRPQRSLEARDASVAPIKARCIREGRGVTAENLRDMRAPWWGCNAGRVIATEALSERERSDLWVAIQHMRRVQAAHDRAIGAPSRHPACLRLMTPPDRLEATAESPPLDMRTDAEKAREATAALMRVETWLGYTDVRAASVAKRVVIDDQHCADRAGLIRALRCVRDGIAGRMPVWRGA